MEPSPFGLTDLALMAGGLAVYLELFTWYRRMCRRHGWAPLPFAIVAVGLALAGVIIDVARAGALIVGGCWWLFGYPVYWVNRQRWDARRTRKTIARAHRRAATATSPGAILAEHSAAQVLARPLPPPPASPVPFAAWGMGPDGQVLYEQASP